MAVPLVYFFESAYVLKKLYMVMLDKEKTLMFTIYNTDLEASLCGSEQAHFFMKQIRFPIFR